MKTNTAINAQMNAIGVLSRLLQNGRGRLTPAMARYLLRLDFDKQDKERMHDLAVRNQEGALSAEEWAELEGYAQAGCLLGILHSKARQTLKRAAKPRSS